MNQQSLTLYAQEEEQLANGHGPHAAATLRHIHVHMQRAENPAIRARLRELEQRVSTHIEQSTATALMPSIMLTHLGEQIRAEELNEFKRIEHDIALVSTTMHDLAVIVKQHDAPLMSLEAQIDESKRTTTEACIDLGVAEERMVRFDALHLVQIDFVKFDIEKLGCASATSILDGYGRCGCHCRYCRHCYPVCHWAIARRQLMYRTFSLDAPQIENNWRIDAPIAEIHR